VEWGLYRLNGIPASEHDDLIRWTLWSRDRLGAPQAAVGHESALVVHELGDLMPAVVHLVVPRGFRKKRPADCELHPDDLGPDDIEEREGFSVTTPLRTLLDLAERPGFSTAVLREAAGEAVRRGLVRRKALQARLTEDGARKLGLSARAKRSRKP